MRDRSLPSSASLVVEIDRLAAKLEVATDELRASAVEEAEAEAAYKLTYARAYLAAEGTVRERECRAELTTNKERLAAGIASGLSRAHLEAVRSLRQQLSAAQSVANSVRAEAELARTGPGA